MCIIVYKPQNVAFPKEEILKNCFERNKDGAGYMFVYNGKVHIRKGFMKYEDFAKDLDKTKAIAGTKGAFVMHFRISTQGGVKQGLCHPYPLCTSYDEMRKLNNECEIGVAHNGIIDLTSTREYGYTWNGKSYTYGQTTLNHNDTMEFIKEYLSLIVCNKDYYKHKNKLKLIEKLCGSRLAILDSNNHCELIGNWIEDNGIYYSNNSYEVTREVKASASKSTKSTPFSTRNNTKSEVEYFRFLYESFEDGLNEGNLVFDYTPYGYDYSECNAYSRNGNLIATCYTGKDLYTENEIARYMDNNIDSVYFDEEMYDEPCDSGLDFSQDNQEDEEEIEECDYVEADLVEDGLPY